MLKLSYRLEVKKWRAGAAINERKKSIQQIIKESFNIAVDMPRDGGAGTSNTGRLLKMFYNSFGIFEIRLIYSQKRKDLSCVVSKKTPSLDYSEA